MLQNHKQSEVIMKGPKNAIPTLKGWAHEMTGEVLKVQKFTTDQIDEWYVANNRINRNKWFLEASDQPVSTTTDEIDQQIHDEITEGKIQAVILDNLSSMTKAEIEAVGRENGIELDRRKTKANMISELEAHIDSL